MNNIGTVIKFTFFNKIRSKSFLISTLVIALLITAGAHIPFFIKIFGGDSDAKVIGYITQTEQEAAFAEQLKPFINYEGSPLELIELTVPEGETADAYGTKQVTSGEVEGYILFGEFANEIPAIFYKSEALADFNTTSILEQVLQIIKQQNIIATAGLSSEIIDQLNAPVQVSSQQISFGSEEGISEDARGINMWIIYGLIIILFMGIMVSGQTIAAEVTAEKSSRVMEVLVTSVSPLASMFGKITGMFLLVLSQLVTYVLVVVINLSLPHNREIMDGLNINFSTLDPFVLIYGLIYFLAGFFLFAVLYAALGSVVSRTEDLGQAVMPMTMISLVGFYIAMFSIATPESTLVTVSSYIPFVSPFTMLLRIGLTNIATWEILVSLAILLVTIYICVVISAKIYRAGVLMYGKRPTMKELFKAVRGFK